jgi:colicin import membrane protein
MTTTPATEKAGALAPPVAELQVTALSAWEALANQIAMAEEESAAKTFDYRDKWDNKEARSWVAKLRRIKGSIERARKDAKAVHIERGKAVDTAAKLLESSVQGLIAPHEAALNAIEAEEEARVAAHRSVLERIAALAEGVTTAADAEARIAELEAIDTTGLEEFAAAGANRQAEALEQLQTLRDTLQQQEAERAELEALRQEKEEREAADRAERLRLEGEQRERERAEQQRQRDADAAREREAQALAAAEASRRAQAEAERRAAEAEERERRAAEVRAAELKSQQEAIQAAAEFEKTRRSEMQQSLIAAMSGKKASEVALAIMDGTFHPAVRLIWSWMGRNN